MMTCSLLQLLFSFFFCLFPPPEFHFLELNISFQCFLFGLLLHHHPMIRSPPPPSPPPSSSSSCSSFAALWWMDWFMWQLLLSIFPLCYACTQVVAKSSIWVCPGSRDDEWFSHCILSCMYIYRCFFCMKVLSRIGFWGRSLLVLWTAACISSGFLNEDTLSTEVLWQVVYLVKNSPFFFLFFQASLFLCIYASLGGFELVPASYPPKICTRDLVSACFLPLFSSPSFFVSVVEPTPSLPLPPPSSSSSSSSSSVVVRSSCTKRPYVCLVASSKTLIQLFV